MKKLKDKIAEVEKHLNVSQRTLSHRMGRSSNYLSSMVLSGCSTDKQGEIIEILNQIKHGKIILSAEERALDLKTQILNEQREIERLQSLLVERDEDMNLLKLEVATLCKNTGSLIKLNTDLHSLLQAQEKNTAYWTGLLPRTAMQAFKLFIKMLFGVK